MKICTTPIEDLLIIEPKVFEDARGYFFESFKESFFTDNGLNYNFIQDNQARSSHGVIRGLHYQLAPFAQAKLVRVISGEILDVAVDLREGSKTFGKHFAIKLSEENRIQLLIPAGFAHGYSVTGEQATVLYKCDNVYSPAHERGIIWNDPVLAIDWQISAQHIIVSDKDKKLPRFGDAEL